MYFNTTMDVKADDELRSVGAVRAEGRRWLAVKKLCVVIASALVAVNIWIGSPLLALWVGSQVQRGMGHLSMTAVFSVIVVLGVMLRSASQRRGLHDVLRWGGGDRPRRDHHFHRGPHS